jgi:hypothetical protein
MASMGDFLTWASTAIPGINNKVFAVRIVLRTNETLRHI